MIWENTEPVWDKSYITKFEKKMSVKLPSTFKSMLKDINGGCPVRNRFIAGSDNKSAVKCLLSLNPGDKNSIWKVPKNKLGYLSEQFVPFGLDIYGNYLCFNKTGAVMLVSPGPVWCEMVAHDFEEFLKKLF